MASWVCTNAMANATLLIVQPINLFGVLGVVLLEVMCSKVGMGKQLHRPLIVWFTIGVLATSCAIFGTGLIGILFVYHQAGMFHIQPTLLLVAMPLIGLVGLTRRKLWGRDVSLLSLASLWAFILRGFWSIFGEKPLAEFRMTPLHLSIFLILNTLLILLPSLFARLRWGMASREFFLD